MKMRRKEENESMRSTLLKPRQLTVARQRGRDTLAHDHLKSGRGHLASAFPWCFVEQGLRGFLTIGSYKQTNKQP